MISSRRGHRDLDRSLIVIVPERKISRHSYLALSWAVMGSLGRALGSGALLKPGVPKTLKTHVFFKVFGFPWSSPRAPWDSPGLPWALLGLSWGSPAGSPLGLSWALLGLPGALLGLTCPKMAPKPQNIQFWKPNWPQNGPKNGSKTDPKSNQKLEKVSDES